MSIGNFPEILSNAISHDTDFIAAAPPDSNRHWQWSASTRLHHPRDELSVVRVHRSVLPESI